MTRMHFDIELVQGVERTLYEMVEDKVAEKVWCEHDKAWVIIPTKKLLKKEVQRRKKEGIPLTSEDQTNVLKLIERYKDAPRYVWEKVPRKVPHGV